MGEAASSAALVACASRGAPLVSTMDKREVASSCFELLHNEFVNQVVSAHEEPLVAQYHLDVVGETVGRRLCERYTMTRMDRMRDHLEIMKFVCKEFWTTVYKKEIDQLKTDYNGTFLILDHRFRGLGSFMGAAVTKEELHPYLQFPCGVLRG